MDNIFTRTINLIGEHGFKKIQNTKILLFGIGGVGGTTLESLIRSGFTKIDFVDFDIVTNTNLNRQILFSSNDIGKFKTDAAISHIKSINPEFAGKYFCEKVDSSFFKNHSFDSVNYIIDAIDDCSAKLEIAKYAQENNIPLIMCLGMGNRLDPSKIYFSTLDKTENDPLARKMRQLARKANLDLSKINVILSKELPVKVVGPTSSMIMVPSAAGLLITFKLIEKIVQ